MGPEQVLISGMKCCENVSCPLGEKTPQPLENFYRDKERPDGLNKFCKTCAPQGHATKQRRANALVKNKERLMLATSKALAVGAENPQLFNQIVDGVFHVWGGAETFATEYVARVRNAKDAYALKAMGDMAKMAQERDKLAYDPLKDLDMITREEIQERLRKEVQAALDEGLVIDGEFELLEGPPGE
jgi:hypothetical protein